MRARPSAVRRGALGAIFALLAATIAALTMTATAAPAGATGGGIITNGTIMLGVHDEGHLNVGGGMPSSGTGTTFVGLRYVPTGAESTAPGCLCEGWGVKDGATGVTGFANEAVDGGPVNIEIESAVFTADTAVTVGIVKDGGTPHMRVTHDYHPSPDTPNLYEVVVTIENLSGAPIDPLYRRVMDWDVEPTAFSEFVTIGGTAAATNVTLAGDDGFETGEPGVFVNGGGGAINFLGDAVDDGPTDHGALFDFAFDPIAPGDDFSFKTFYGAAATETEADAALAAAGIEVFSYGQTATDPLGGTPNTFIFGFGGVGGTTILPGVRLSSDAYMVVEDAGPAVVTVELNGPAADPVTVELDTTDGSATSPADYAATSTTVMFAPGEVSKDVMIPVVDDGVMEGDETFRVRLSSPTGATLLMPDAATVTIKDPAGPPPTGTCMGVPATIVHTGGGLVLGTAGDDVIVVDDAMNTIVRALQGNDLVCGGDGDDSIYLDSGHDKALAGGGNDIVFGQDGHDEVWGEGGDDWAALGRGNDDFHGGLGNDEAYGGPGSDLMFGDEGNDILDGASDDDELHGGPDGDLLAGGAGDDALFGEGGDDILKGGDDGDRILGGEGADLLIGGFGDDTMDGEAGTDTHWAGPGIDTCFAQAGDGDTATAACETVIVV